MEVHDCPEKALSDGPNALPLERMQSLLNILRDIHRLVRTAIN
jgi:2-dehydro-3-deoxyphosphooctonate aldolase (KDO 8-P synthase)